MLGLGMLYYPLQAAQRGSEMLVLLGAEAGDLEILSRVHGFCQPLRAQLQGSPWPSDP